MLFSANDSGFCSEKLIKANYINNNYQKSNWQKIKFN